MTKGRNGIRITSIATIDATGMGDCFLVCWSSDRAVFEASLKRVMKSNDDVGVLLFSATTATQSTAASAS